jgi:thiol-disulfide isomerase/thioredoxin
MKKILLSSALMIAGLMTGWAAGADTGPQFLHDFKEALKAGKKANKPVVLIYSASWCPPCQMMVKEVYPSKEVKEYVNKYVWAYLDVDVAKNMRSAETYGVGGIPRILLVNPAGDFLNDQTGASDPKDFADFLSKGLKKFGK